MRTALFVALRPLVPFQQAQYAQVFPLKPALFCTLFAGFGSTNKSVTCLLFSAYLTLALFSPHCPLLLLCFYLNLSGRSDRKRLFSPPVLSGYNGFPDTRFSRETFSRLMSWSRGALFMNFAIPYSPSSFISCIYSFLFSNWRRTVSPKFFRQFFR